jgi:hypothetical protein
MLLYIQAEVMMLTGRAGSGHNILEVLEKKTEIY